MISRLLKIFGMRRIYNRVRSLVRSNWIFYVIVLVYIIAMSTLTILKNHTFLTSGFDLGIFNQAFHTTLFDGKFFYETGDLSFNPGGSFFGVHFSPILFVLLPFYAVYPSAENLLVMQTVILALGAFPVYWITRDKLGQRVALAISIVYFLYPPLYMLNLNDFHLEAFTSTFFLFSVYYLQQEKWMKFSAFMILAMLTIEFAPIIGVFVALYGLFLYSKNRFKDGGAGRKYLVLTVLIAVIIFVLGYEIKESFNTSTSPLPSPFHYVLSDPAATLNVFFSDWGSKMFYLINLLAPLAFLPLFAPETLIMALPWAFFSFSSTYSFYYSVYFQYTGFVIPFVVVALPGAIKRLNPQDVRKILALILVCTAILGLYLPVGQGSPWNYQLPLTNERTESIRKMLTLIPPDASILTENNIFPSVSNRANAYMYNSSSTSVFDYILVDIESQWYTWKQPGIFGSRTPLDVYTIPVLENRTFGIVASINGVLLLKKGYTGEPKLFIPYVASFNYKNLTKGNTTLFNEDSSSTSKWVLFHGPVEPPGVENITWYGPYVTLPFGLYKATFVVKVDNSSELNPSDHLLTLNVTASAGNVQLDRIYVYGKDVPANGGWFNVTLPFGLREPYEDVEFAGYAAGGTNVSLDYVTVEQLSPPPSSITELAFNARELSAPHKEDPQGFVNWTLGNFSSNGVFTRGEGKTQENESKSGTLWWGPYVSLPNGSYTARFWLRLDNASYDGTLIDLKVMKNNATELLNSLAVHGSDFKQIGTWQSFEVNFGLSEASDGLEFRGDVKQYAPVSFLYVEVYTRTEG
jgi:uncharacterized membrane protein